MGKLKGTFKIQLTVTNTIEPGDSATFTEKNKMHKTKEGEVAHYISGEHLEKNDTVTITLNSKL